jgi:hypothetical protein
VRVRERQSRERVRDLVRERVRGREREREPVGVRDRQYRKWPSRKWHVKGV